MSKLKTLKDLGYSEQEDGDVCKYELKQEAIKLVKSHNTGGFTFEFDFEGKVTRWFKTKKELNFIDTVNLGAMIEFINFFNITEENLK